MFYPSSFEDLGLFQDSDPTLQNVYDANFSLYKSNNTIIWNYFNAYTGTTAFHFLGDQICHKNKSPCHVGSGSFLRQFYESNPDTAKKGHFFFLSFLYHMHYLSSHRFSTVNIVTAQKRTFLGVLGVMGVLCFILLPMAKLASSRVSGSTHTDLESKGGSFLETAIAWEIKINILNILNSNWREVKTLASYLLQEQLPSAFSVSWQPGSFAGSGYDLVKKFIKIKRWNKKWMVNDILGKICLLKNKIDNS